MTLTELMDISTIIEGNESRDVWFLWKDIVLDSRINKETFLNQLWLKFTNAIPVVTTVSGFKSQSDSFFKKWAYQIGKLLDTQEFEYNPIWNKDGKTHEHRTIERELNREMDRGDDYSEDMERGANGHVENQVSADDSSAYQPHDQSSSTDSINDHISSSRDIGQKDTEGEVTGDDFWRVEQGNIGVTTTQQMINEERALYEFNVINWILKKYGEELFLRVW